MDKTQYLKEDSISVINDVFGEVTVRIFSASIRNKSNKELILLLEDLLIDYLGESKAGEIIYLLSHKHDI